MMLPLTLLDWIAVAVFVVMLVIMFRELALGLCFWGYALYGPARYLWTRWNRTAVPPSTIVDTQPSTN